MKTCLVILFALAAGALSAQPPSPDPSAQTVTTGQPSQQKQQVFKPQDQNYAVHRGRLTYDGVAVQAANAPQHLEIFNPIDRNNSPAPDNTVWQDQSKGKATGWSIFSIKF